ncbi:MAG TPA: response regulator transcription factor [Opitutaceae bacterium]|nr:response regulator transcription factor [Opitutaceae bacterium]
MSAAPARPPIRIMLVDDHILMRMGLASATNNEADMRVVAEAEDGLEAIEAYRQHQPDVVILDLRMPRRNGIETIAVLRREFSSARVLVLSNYSSGEEVAAALQAGARGYASKDMPLDTLLDAIRRVHEGEQFIPPEIARRLAGRMLSQLSARELEVLALIAKGKSNKEVAAALHLVEGTVKVHVTNILSKLGVADRTQAILAAVKRGILQLD